ncbi:alpha/beta hydrolase [Xanthomonas translucens]|uniref:alpha/beta hydrolase n=3 Tax=Xanthomonas campestris pv. translucens TaxID=343 RepID=UPI00071E68DC|nr:alpha/beta fold hydrolase [Xanthomonas translucens]KTF39255.1 alpha/beta hydrolase [Xanthomonas translucens pv. translucens]MCS3361711.1 lysophospholipase [Xanthomonas translucens pv. translucens]MCS3375306.1 lysophospholipase [Xanthomonas translucens pv. translucens]MCT8276340.1 lysophospholipase [Xanthomonas translucens pv. translucens]MCT8280094.1 lysophospholipase [Xanthomonas translucens pv. translucens]
MLRHLGIVAAIAAVAYLVVCALLYLGQRDLLYFPQATRVAAAQTDFTLPRRPALRLRGWQLNPGRDKVLLYFGGNAEDLRQARAQLAPLLPGYSVYLLAYLGYGASDGTPNEAALIGDALALYDHVRAAQPQAEIAVLGRSLGSGVASQLAARRPLARLVLVTPFDSLVAAAQAHYPWAPVRWLLRDRYDSASALRTYRGPLLVLRAGRDQVVPAASTQRLLDALPQAPTLVALPHAGHNDISADPRYAQALRAFLR